MTILYKLQAMTFGTMSQEDFDETLEEESEDSDFLDVTKFDKVVKVRTFAKTRKEAWS